MTMTHFAVYEIADLTESEPIGEIVVSAAGKITLSADADSPSAHRLGAAVDTLRAAASLDLRSRSQTEDGNFLLKVEEVNPDDPLFAMAVSDVLSWRFGFRCVEQDDIDNDA